MNVLNRLFWFLLLALWLAAPARAVLTIEITEGVEGAAPIAVVPFGWEGPGTPPPINVGQVVAADLQRTGRFAPIAEGDLLGRPTAGNEVRFPDWRMLGAESLVVGRLRPAQPAGYVVQFQLFDVFKAKQLTGYSFSAKAEDLRRVAHRISDIVYEQLTGQPGAFSTRIAYVTAERLGGGQSRYALQVADADGVDPQTILRSDEPIMSPNWSPDGSRLAYVSFEKKHSAIYVQDVATGRRQVVAEYPGINGAPAWSPDGRRLALTLSREDNPDIYLLELATKELRRLTTNAAIDTEPTWTPDGSAILFTSDRGGGPQVYRMAASGGTAQRLTFEGSYNARPTVSPDGRSLAVVHAERGAFRIAVYDLESHTLRVLTKGSLDESPSFAPNGSMIIYATEYQNRGVLSAVSVDGRVHQRLLLSEGDVREPVWSPFRRR
ncbi:Tol-Pal system beta propeller repeat protein TolB [Endothiovibrio diazotrophicus]